MRRITLSLFSSIALLGCGDIGDGPGPDIPDPDDTPVSFTVRVSNVSGDAFPTPLSPLAWALHDQADPLFDLGAGDRGEGLEALAEDGNPAELATSLEGLSTIAAAAAFNLPTGELTPGPLFPGGEYAFTVEARPSDGNLSLATMLVQTNDVFLAPDGDGIELFDGDGVPLEGVRDVTDQFLLWDAGTEANQVPRMGPDQAPRQSAPNTGGSEGRARLFSDATRALPIAADVAEITVTESGGAFTIAVSNVSSQRGALVTPIAPVFYAVHNDDYSLFTAGQPDDGMGLELLAEDGSPAGLVASQPGRSGVLAAGARTETNERPGQPGASLPGETFEFTVSPDPAHPYLTIAAMVVESNDAFLSFGPSGIRLLDGDGVPRAAADIEADIGRHLAIWDAGTEANEVPGAGAYQVLRQPASGGPADPNTAVRLYADSTNDLAGPLGGGFARLTIVAGTAPGSFDVTVENLGPDVFRGILTPVAFAVHNESASLFEIGERVSNGLEVLAESGNPMPLVGEMNARSGVLTAGAQPVAVGASGPGPIGPGGRYTFTVTLDVQHRFLSLATMVVPSNDTFLAFGPAGIELLEPSGARRSDADIAADIAEFVAWDAGTEANQSGAAGRDQAPRQGTAVAGAGEGPGTVRVLDDRVYSHPSARDVIRVTIEARP